MMKYPVKWLTPFMAILLMLGMTSLYFGCDESSPVQADGREGARKSPVSNHPPNTYLTLGVSPGEMPDTSASRKIMHWWGEDEDGRVVGYRYRWGKLDEDPDNPGVILDTTWIDSPWVETDLDSALFYLPIRSASEIFTFQVKAIDNEGAEDPSPAQVSYPIVNSRPTIAFRLNSNPIYERGTFTTFTTRTFIWDAIDPDGDETIEAIFYALDPLPGDTQWVELEGTAGSVTLRDLEIGTHSFWVKVRDLAGFESVRIHFPDSTVNTDPASWEVKQPVGEYLIVDDYALDVHNVHLNFYKAIFDSLYNGMVPGEGVVYSVWEIGRDLPASPVDINETLMQFHKIFWFSYYGEPTLVNAFNSMYAFINTPGNRMVLSTMTVDSGMVNEFADSMYTATLVGNLATLPSDTARMVPVDVSSGLPILELIAWDVIGRDVIGLIPNENGEAVYTLDECTSQPPDPVQYEGQPIVGVRRPDKSYTIITVPLFPFRAGHNIGEAIRVLLDE